MNAIKPTVAINEFADYTFEEIRFAKNLKSSIDDFFKILSGEKKGRNAKIAMLELINEIEEAEGNE
jgi:hypothetical protein